eukprot:3069700-Amphidinium_carterae.1
MAGSSWDCGTAGIYNFGYRTECFACKRARGNAKINRTGGPSSKPGSPAPKPGGPATKAGEPPTKSSANSHYNQSGLLTEQTLRKQIGRSGADGDFGSCPFQAHSIGPHQHVVEHETYAICLDCQRHVGLHTGRKCFNYYFNHNNYS